MTDEAPVPEHLTPDRSLLIIGGGIVVVVVVAVIAVVLLGSRDAQTFAADAPEGVVQRHLVAVEDEDYDRRMS